MSSATVAKVMGIASPGASISALSRPGDAVAELSDVREGTLALISDLTDGELEATHSPIMSPLVWDLAHIAAYEDLWLVHRFAGRPLLRPDLAELYDAFETPRSIRGEIELLDVPQTHRYLVEVRERTTTVIEELGVGDGQILEMVLRHELQHTETMRQTMRIAGLLPAGEPPPAGMATQQSWVHIPAGPFTMGASADGFAYDNERPCHPVDVAAFQIAALPVSNAEWLSFCEDGGYRRRELWSEEGWAHVQRDAIEPDLTAMSAAPHAPACHISWFEAQAFARAHSGRLPTEAQWEKAVRTAPGAVCDVGSVWEWTRSCFVGYPGFRAHPYREYSEVFFGARYRVLRGGSWATSDRVKSPTFRNWDLPQRRQIFAGLRLTQEG